MHPAVERLVRQVTSVTLFAAAILVGLGVAGITPSPFLAAGAAGLAGLCFTERERLVGLVDVEALRVHAETLWIGPAIAALALLLFGDLTTGELQTVGALIGLVGMLNYLLRPVYLLVASIVGRLGRVLA